MRAVERRSLDANPMYCGLDDGVDLGMDCPASLHSGAVLWFHAAGLVTMRLSRWCTVVAC